ncbi:MAG: hypothetical protein JSW12_22330 [Deltaproteobacteria bacterium]|nr:MAG: hypothetical protein JSW12_22330 [Deltaproteobacteria bacterium]
MSAKAGRIVKIRRDRKNPANLRRSCPDRLPHLVKWLYHPDQLMYPSGCQQIVKDYFLIEGLCS